MPVRFVRNQVVKGWYEITDHKYYFGQCCLNSSWLQICVLIVNHSLDFEAK